ncbi:MAG: TIGR04150 pseudo-rSAM protein [Bacteroidales bacterium]|nr:TIGR04150 pseudo-rSAM protein [Bacteroidales bacterium]
MEKKYWFYLEPHIYVKFQEKEVFLYNTQSGSELKTLDKDCIKLIQGIYEEEALGCIEIAEKDCSQTSILEFLQQIKRRQMGKIVDVNSVDKKPVVLLPIMSLNRDVEKIKKKKEPDLELVQDYATYLLDVNIKLNDDCPQRCKSCNDYYKQFRCCSRKGDGIMEEETLTKILNQLNYYTTKNINFIGGNIYQYDNLDIIQRFVWRKSKELHFYTNYLNYIKNEFVDSQKLHILIPFPFDTDRVTEIVAQTRGLSVTYHLIFDNEEQYRELAECLSENGVEDYIIHPFYNGKNKPFFEENVFLSKEDILGRTISKREIFRNTKLNANYFGSLYFMPDGTIKAHPDRAVIGDIHKGRIVDAIHNEMMKNTAWREVREGNPCSSCAYQYLCPPISNYEHAIGQINLCKNE